jgi:Astacin (Peptidase family M12A)
MVLIKVTFAASADVQLIQRDLRTIELKTCIRFQPRTTQANYVKISNRAGCWSYLGRTGGMQILSLQNPGCVWAGTVAHEFIHALGKGEFIIY